MIDEFAKKQFTFINNRDNLPFAPNKI